MAPPLPRSFQQQRRRPPPPPPSPPSPQQKQQQQQQPHDPSTQPVPLVPLFAPLWAFEVEGSHVHRLLTHFPHHHEGGHKDKLLSSPPSPHQDTHTHTRAAAPAGCIADRSQRHATCLLAARTREDLMCVPENHRRYILRVFFIPHACRDVGWLPHSRELKEALRKARRYIYIYILFKRERDTYI